MRPVHCEVVQVERHCPGVLISPTPESPRLFLEILCLGDLTWFHQANLRVIVPGAAVAAI